MSDNRNSLIKGTRHAGYIDPAEAGSLATNLEMEAGRIAAENTKSHHNAKGHPIAKSPSRPGKVQGIDRNNQPDVVPGEMLEDAKFTQT
jgi:hypothetical protein